MNENQHVFIEVQDENKANLLTLVLAKILRDKISLYPIIAKKVVKIKGILSIKASEMWATIVFDKGKIRLSCYEHKNPDAKVISSLPSLVSINKKLSLLSSLMRGKIKIQGNPLFLLRVLFILLAKKGGTNGAMEK